MRPQRSAHRVEKCARPPRLLLFPSPVPTGTPKARARLARGRWGCLHRRPTSLVEHRACRPAISPVVGLSWLLTARFSRDTASCHPRRRGRMATCRKNGHHIPSGCGSRKGLQSSHRTSMLSHRGIWRASVGAGARRFYVAAHGSTRMQDVAYGLCVRHNPAAFRSGTGSLGRALGVLVRLGSVAP